MFVPDMMMDDKNGRLEPCNDPQVSDETEKAWEYFLLGLNPRVKMLLNDDRDAMFIFHKLNSLPLPNRIHSVMLRISSTGSPSCYNFEATNKIIYLFRRSEADDEIIFSLVRKLESLSDVKLSLRSVYVTRPELATTTGFATRILREGRHISILDFDRVSLSTGTLFEETAEYLANYGGLEELRIRQSEMNDVQMNALAEALARSPSQLKILNLRGNNVGAKCFVDSLAKIFQAQKKLETLMLGFNEQLLHFVDLADETIRSLEETLKNQTSLRHLRFNNCGADVAAISSLLSVCTANNKLLELNLTTDRGDGFPIQQEWLRHLPLLASLEKLWLPLQIANDPNFGSFKTVLWQNTSLLYLINHREKLLDKCEPILRRNLLLRHVKTFVDSQNRGPTNIWARALCILGSNNGDGTPLMYFVRQKSLDLAMQSSRKRKR